MQITFNFCLQSYVQKDGTQKILLRLTQNRAHKYIDIGYAIKKADWNTEKQEVRKSHPLATSINMAMQAKLLEVQKEYLKHKVESRTVSANEIKRKIKNEMLGISLSYMTYARERVKTMPSASTREGQTSVLDKLQSYIGADKELYFDDFTFEFLKKYFNEAAPEENDELVDKVFQARHNTTSE